MKMILMSMLMIAGSAQASDLHVRAGEQVNVVVEGCKTSEYGAVKTLGPAWKDSSEFVAKCMPKRCSFHTPTWFGTVITLLPDDKELARTSSKSETKAVLDKLLKDGIC